MHPVGEIGGVGPRNVRHLGHSDLVIVGRRHHAPRRVLLRHQMVLAIVAVHEGIGDHLPGDRGRLLVGPDYPPQRVVVIVRLGIRVADAGETADRECGPLSPVRNVVNSDGPLIATQGQQARIRREGECPDCPRELVEDMA